MLVDLPDGGGRTKISPASDLAVVSCGLDAGGADALVQQQVRVNKIVVVVRSLVGAVVGEELDHLDLMRVLVSGVSSVSAWARSRHE